MADMFGFGEIKEDLSPELRKELMDLATSMRSIAERIDVITKRKASKELDANGEPKFKFSAKVSIPGVFYITKHMANYAIQFGFTEAEIKRMADTFVIYYNKSGVKWQDWTRVWFDWVRREKSRKDKGIVTSDTLKKW